MTTLLTQTAPTGAISITILVPNVVEVMASYTLIKVYRATQGINATYSEVSDSSTRIPLTANGTAYRFVDPYGAADYWYRIGFYNPTSHAESPLSEPQQGNADDVFDIMTVKELKEIYLVGVDLTDTSGAPFPDVHFEHSIRSAVSWLEHRIDIPILPEVVTDERQDFYAPEYEKLIWLNLDRFPLISIQQIRLVLPTNQLVVIYDPSWIHVQRETGQVNIIPGAGQIALGLSNWSTLIRGGSKFLPDVFRIDYTAGFERGKVPYIFKDLIGKIASFGPLNLAGDLLGGAGIASQSTSIDGLSQSVNTTSSPSYSGYGARLAQYTREIKEVIPTLRRYYKGQRMTVA